jgi:hypothetical protein
MNIDPAGSGMTIFGYDFGQPFQFQSDPNSLPDSKFYDVAAGSFSTKKIFVSRKKNFLQYM